MPVRPRSVYTAHSYNQVQTRTTVQYVYGNFADNVMFPTAIFVKYKFCVQEESNLSAFQDYSKFLEGGLGQAELGSAAGWQPPWRAPLQRKAPFYPGDDIYHADTWRELEVRAYFDLYLHILFVHKCINCKYYESLTLPDPFQELLVINKYRHRTICSKVFSILIGLS